MDSFIIYLMRKNAIYKYVKIYMKYILDCA